MYNRWGCILIYLPMSYPFKSLYATERRPLTYIWLVSSWSSYLLRTRKEKAFIEKKNTQKVVLYGRFFQIAYWAMNTMKVIVEEAAILFIFTMPILCGGALTLDSNILK